MIKGLAVTAAAALLAACSATSGTPPVPTNTATVSAHQPKSSTVDEDAINLWQLDGNSAPQMTYTAALDALVPLCTQTRSDIAALANSGYQDLVANHVTDETRLTVLMHMRESIPSGRQDCQGILAAYLVLRESPS